MVCWRHKRKSTEDACGACVLNGKKGGTIFDDHRLKSDDHHPKSGNHRLKSDNRHQKSDDHRPVGHHKKRVAETKKPWGYVEYSYKIGKGAR